MAHFLPANEEIAASHTSTTASVLYVHSDGGRVREVSEPTLVRCRRPCDAEPLLHIRHTHIDVEISTWINH